MLNILGVIMEGMMVQVGEYPFRKFMPKYVGCCLQVTFEWFSKTEFV